ncbi:hypothetical protein B0E47_06195 [Rhodanobacter sp. B05]|uniref:hypothetical protein n=1 Tax=Rhodanobacter sp. B05 TaxID=1945859 RepID=UPI0009C62EC1|nr:hypothetical protein [Rhodanobacter sp. B05]OOG57805.1 hypothetical protein B0E47_06195 [Rhodanobacter sp. B05]
MSVRVNHASSVPVRLANDQRALQGPRDIAALAHCAQDALGLRSQHPAYDMVLLQELSLTQMALTAVIPARRFSTAKLVKRGSSVFRTPDNLEGTGFLLSQE